MRRYGGAIAWISSIIISVLLYSQIEAEQHARDRDNASRRAQNCEVFTRTYTNDKRKYDNGTIYLDSLTPEERGDKLNQAIAKERPFQLKALQAEKPPKYCYHLPVK